VILVTVGMQLGFDRLVRAMDELAPALQLPVYAQVGKGAYIPKNMEYSERIEAGAFDDLIARTSLIVSHAGIGTVLTAQRMDKPILLFPRRAALGEHRNDHQMATVRELENRPGIVVAYEAADLAPAIARGLALEVGQQPPRPDRDRLREAVRGFIATGSLG